MTAGEALAHARQSARKTCALVRRVREDGRSPVSGRREEAAVVEVRQPDTRITDQAVAGVEVDARVDHGRELGLVVAFGNDLRQQIFESVPEQRLECAPWRA